MRNAAFRRAPKVVVDEEDDEEDEPLSMMAPPPPPRGVASLSASVAHSSAALVRAVSQLGRSLRLRKLRKLQAQAQ